MIAKPLPKEPIRSSEFVEFFSDRLNVCAICKEPLSFDSAIWPTFRIDTASGNAAHSACWMQLQIDEDQAFLSLIEPPQLPHCPDSEARLGLLHAIWSGNKWPTVTVRLHVTKTDKGTTAFPSYLSWEDNDLERLTSPASLDVVFGTAEQNDEGKSGILDTMANLMETTFVLQTDKAETDMFDAQVLDFLGNEAAFAFNGIVVANGKEMVLAAPFKPTPEEIKEAEAHKQAGTLFEWLAEWDLVVKKAAKEMEKRTAALLEAYKRKNKLELKQLKLRPVAVLQRWSRVAGQNKWFVNALPHQQQHASQYVVVQAENNAWTLAEWSERQGDIRPYSIRVEDKEHFKLKSLRLLWP